MFLDSSMIYFSYKPLNTKVEKFITPVPQKSLFEFSFASEDLNGCLADKRMIGSYDLIKSKYNLHACEIPDKEYFND